jgi:hypothetical protein
LTKSAPCAIIKLSKGKVREIKMMNTYLRTMEFEIDGKVTNSESWVVLVDEKDAALETVVDGQGKTFASLWDYMQTSYNGLNVPANLWTRAFWSNKRRIEFFTKTKTWIEDGTERPWSVTYSDEPYGVSMERLMKFDADRVTQYLQERNLKIGVDK